MPTILVVDDENQVRDLIVKTLLRHGYEVIPAINGVEALRVYAANPAKIDLVLTDVLMPELNGIELMYRMMKLKHPKPLRVILMSGYTAGVMEAEDVRTHVRMIDKPFRAAQLLGAIASELETSGIDPPKQS